MADLAADPANGPSRILLLEPLVRTEEGRRRLESFQDDNVLGHEVRRLLRKRSAQAGADRLRAKYQPTTADLAELGSIDVDLERVALLMRALGAALGLDDGCRRAVAKMAGSLDVGEGQVLECRSRHGPIRIELFADDIDAIDLDVYGRAHRPGGPSIRCSARTLNRTDLAFDRRTASMVTICLPAREAVDIPNPRMNVRL